MRYSCFDQATGTYSVFEDAQALPVNADLPVPRLGAALNGIGVPANEAARPLPPSARFVGASNRPVGVVVACRAAGSGFGALDLGGDGGLFPRAVLYGVGAGVALYAAWRVFS